MLRTKLKKLLAHQEGASLGAAAVVHEVGVLAIAAERLVAILNVQQRLVVNHNGMPADIHIVGQLTEHKGVHRIQIVTVRLEERRQLIDVFVNTVFLYSDRFLLTLNFGYGSKTVLFTDIPCSDKVACGRPQNKIA